MKAERMVSVDLAGTGFSGYVTKRKPIKKLCHDELRSRRREDISHCKGGGAAVLVVKNILD